MSHYTEALKKAAMQYPKIYGKKLKYIQIKKGGDEFYKESHINMGFKRKPSNN